MKKHLSGIVGFITGVLSTTCFTYVWCYVSLSAAFAMTTFVLLFGIFIYIKSFPYIKSHYEPPHVDGTFKDESALIIEKKKVPKIKYAESHYDDDRNLIRRIATITAEDMRKIIIEETRKVNERVIRYNR